jgi:hypothetical protein
LALGCSGGEKKTGDENASPPGTRTYDPNAQTGVGGAAASQPSVNVEFVGSSGDNCSIKVNGAACAGITYEPEPTPLDIYVMFDQTGSTLSCVDPADVAGTDARCKMTRIGAIRNAMAQFMADPESAGIGIGIGYFGQFPIGSTDCRDAAYATPAVPISALPGNATAMTTSPSGDAAGNRRLARGPSELSKCELLPHAR